MADELDVKKVDETDDFNLYSMNEGFSMDGLDNWSTLIGLVKSVIDFIEKSIPACKVHLFYHTAEYREYREIDCEGITSFTDDSLFVGCLSMVNGVVVLDKLFSEYQIDDPMIEEVLRGLYKGKYVVPIVHHGSMMAFILLCQKEDGADDFLNDEKVVFLRRLSKRLQVNLYAASIATRKQRELLKLAQYPLMLQNHDSLQKVYDDILMDLMNIVPFDIGVAYAYDDASNSLFPFATYSVSENVGTLKPGYGISGQVFQSWTSIFIPDRNSHPAYSLMDEEGFIDGSFISVPLGTEQNKIGVITLIRKKDSKESFSLEHQYRLEIAVAFTASEIRNRKLIARLEESNFNVVQSLSKALDAKDKYTEGHSERVAKYSVEIAKRLNYSEDRVHLLRYAALLHDIGKIGISDEIINKPERLTDEEFDKIKKHTELGYNILSVNPFFADIKEYVLYHHESLDGSGYEGKKEGEIPEESMVISCADIYDALTSDRSYRKALERDQALEILNLNIGTHFTKEIYDAFLNYLSTKPE